MMTDEDRIAVVAYRMENARRTLDEVTFHIKQGFYNTAMNRMYYACFYAVSALLVNEGIETKTHAGVRQMLGMHFVRTGKFPIPLSKFYTDLFDNRQIGDYEDFIYFDEETTSALYPQALELVETIERMLFK
ncbi:HEPN domain-containing protein [Bacteroides intestinalis]|jgi:uncharacterized protein (UPF0332 family)|nr:HEPN domain-containing protein [Bacteroides intestinalis]